MKERHDVSPTAWGKPAVALVGTDGDSDRVAGAILRADRNGHHVLFACEDGSDPEAVDFARRLGATVTDQESLASPEVIEGLLARTAREHGFPGVIYHDVGSGRIDYDASLESFRRTSRYAVPAETEAEPDGAMEVLVAIPCYNEGRTVEATVRAAAEYADRVVVVDDGSDDETARTAEAAGATVVSHERNRGYGAALKTAFRYADRHGVNCLVVLDGDGQHDPGDVPELVSVVEDGADVAIGSRFVDGSNSAVPRHRLHGLKVINLLTNLSLGIFDRKARITDTQSGFRAYGRRAIRTLARHSTIDDGMGASTDILYHVHHAGYQIEDVPSTIEYDASEVNLRSSVEHGLHLVNNLLRTIETDRPLLVLGLPGLLAVTIGFGFGYWTVFNYLSTGSFPYGIAITATLFVLSGFLALFTSVVLHAFNHQRLLYQGPPRR